MRLDKIYTKVGDKGFTHLATGAKVSKSALRIEAYGHVDELNAHVGLLLDFMALHGRAEASRLGGLTTALALIQQELFDVGGELATPLPQLNLERQKVVGAAAITRLEEEMDEFNRELPPLLNFVLPGGHITNSQAHVVRCVCRRAERAVVRLGEAEALRPEAAIYLNRLSDWFFVASRYLSLIFASREVLWQQNR